MDVLQKKLGENRKSGGWGTSFLKEEERRDWRRRRNKLWNGSRRLGRPNGGTCRRGRNADRLGLADPAGVRAATGIVVALLPQVRVRQHHRRRHREKGRHQTDGAEYSECSLHSRSAQRLKTRLPISSSGGRCSPAFSISQPLSRFCSSRSSEKVRIISRIMFSVISRWNSRP